MERSTLAVLTNTAATGAIGAAFWLLAAALYPENIVAASVAGSSVLIAVSFLSQLNLATGLSRYLPGAAGAQRWVVTSAYRAALSVACLASLLIIVIGLARGGSIISGGDFGLTVVVACSVPLWVVFALQDGALVALRRAHWLPIENGLTSVAKLVLLVALVSLSGRSAVLIAWTLPALPAVWIVNRLIFRDLLDPGRDVTPPALALIKYSVSDLGGAAATLISLRVVPLLVVEVLPTAEAAYVAVPWSIVTVAALALPAVSRLVLSEMSHAPDSAEQVAARSTRFVLLLFVPGAVLGAALSNVVLGLAGDGYAETGTPVLAVGMLGLIPAALIECRYARYRFAGRMLAVTFRQLLRAVVLLVSTIVLLALDRGAWIGVAFLVANLVTLTVVSRTPVPNGTADPPRGR